MSDSKEKLKYQLEKFRQKKLQQELEEIRNILSNSQRKREQISNKRRHENIYILFALAIIGGFLTILQQSSVLQSSAFVAAFAVFASTSSLFVFLKINTVAFAEPSFYPGARIGNIDDYADYIFVYSINGIFILFSAFIVVNALEIDINTASTLVFTLIIGVVSIIFTYATEHYKQMKREDLKNREKKKSEEFKKELIEEVISNINEMKKADNRKEELDIYLNKLSKRLHACQNEFTEPEDFDPIFEELDDLEDLSDEVADSLVDSFDRSKETIRNRVIERATIEEKIERIEQDYEKVAFSEN